MKPVTFALAASLVAALAVTSASAEGLPPLNLARERADLEQAFAGQAGIAPVFLTDATLDELQAAIPSAASSSPSSSDEITRMLSSIASSSLRSSSCEVRLPVMTEIRSGTSWPRSV